MTTPIAELQLWSQGSDNYTFQNVLNSKKCNWEICYLATYFFHKVILMAIVQWIKHVAYSLAELCALWFYDTGNGCRHCFELFNTCEVTAYHRLVCRLLAYPRQWSFLALLRLNWTILDTNFCFQSPPLVFFSLCFSWLICAQTFFYVACQC